MAYFQTESTNFGKILKCLAMEDVGLYYDHLVYYTAIRKILWPFGIFCGRLVYFMVNWCILSRFGMFYQ
jgi:hypothetical protein